MRRIIVLVSLLFACACVQEESEVLVHRSKEDRQAIHQETLKNEKEALESIGIDTSKPVNIKEMMEKAREASANNRGE
ncbi:MAG: hypothetical protein CL942_08445 [Desulfovibrio sp.]|nr:hypothetical protein [Desulfovibrio sp.]|tara:strand:- start:894 stop:1127 length:234 start_codon:yes stop_codon:yes gene_type:complete